MHCCQPGNSHYRGTSRTGGTNRLFSRFSRGYAKSFRRKGLEKVQRLLQEGVLKGASESANGLQDLEILDIGCGVGGLHMTLLEQGAARARGIDIAEGMLDHAREIAADRELGDRVEYINGDFVELAESVPPADVTLLDKVVCCYENVEDLVRLSTEHTRRIYAVSRPRDIWFMRWVFRSQSWIMKTLRFAFYPCWHNWNEVHARILAAGFAPVFQEHTTLWDVAVYRRA